MPTKRAVIARRRWAREQEQIGHVRMQGQVLVGRPCDIAAVAETRRQGVSSIWTGSPMLDVIPLFLLILLSAAASGAIVLVALIRR